MKKKLKLRNWVKVTLKCLAAAGALVLLVALFKIGENRYNDMYEACDNAKGYTCSYYEARQFAIRGE